MGWEYLEKKLGRYTNCKHCIAIDIKT